MISLIYFILFFHFIPLVCLCLIFFLMFLMLVICFEIKGVLNICLLVDGITNCLFIDVTDVIVTRLDVINPVIVGYLLVMML